MHILENDAVSVQIDPKTGGISSIADKHSGREYVAAPDRAAGVRCIVPKPGLECSHVDVSSPAIDIKGATCTLQYDNNEITAAVTLSLRSEYLSCALTIHNAGNESIEETIFPRIQGLGKIPDGNIVWPFLAKTRIKDPLGNGLGGDHHTWNEFTQKYVGRYPETLTSAWLDYGNTEGGLALESLHTDFSIADFSLHRVVEKAHNPVRRTLDIAITHPRRIAPGETYTFPETVIRLHTGDWHQTARAHRKWLETWITKPVVPQKFAESIGWHFAFMKHQDGHVIHTYEDLPKVADAALAAGCPYILLFGWQQEGHDNAYFYRYYPNKDWGGVEALRKAVTTCRTKGVEIIPFFNGTLANITMPEHTEFGHRWEAKTRAGHPYYAGDWARQNFDSPSRNRSMLHHEICPCPEHREYFLETARRIVKDYGFGNIQLDQIAQKMVLCYDETHEHTKPDRAYVDGLSDILTRLRKELREHSPDGIMLSEGMNEFAGQWSDSSWDWRALLDSPEPILYTIPWAWGSAEIDALEYRDVNSAFLHKIHLDMKIDGGDGLISNYPGFAAFVAERASLRKAVAPYYVHADFRDQDGIHVSANGEAAVRLYHDPVHHKAGIVMAELGGKDAEVTIANGWLSRGATGMLHSTNHEPVTTDVESHMTFTLSPYEVRVLCMDGTVLETTEPA